MTFDEYGSFDAVGLADLIRAEQVKVGEVLDAAIGSVAAFNPGLNAVIHQMYDQAHKRLAKGIPDGPFRGVPFLIKDLGVNVAGTVTTNGSFLFASGRAADYDSEIVRRYRAAGLVLIGKTNAPEFGLAPTTEPALHGPTRNPHDPSRSPGGSSGGAAAAVAGRMVPAAHASDGGGSIRIPAAWCGLFGLKPSRGRVSYAPDRGHSWAGMGTQHALTRTVRDSAALLDVASGPTAGDPYWTAPPAGTFLESAAREPQSLRVGLCVAAPNGAEVDEECRRAAEATAALMEALGHQVEPILMPLPAGLMDSAQGTLVAANVAASVREKLRELGRPLASGDLEPVTAAVVEWAEHSTSVDYVAAEGSMHEVGRRMAELFERIDVLVTPTTACLPLPIGAIDGADPTVYAERAALVAAFTSVANMSGQPAMSLPLGWATTGLPIGTQVIGRYGMESTLLSLAGQIERAHPWPTQWAGIA